MLRRLGIRAKVLAVLAVPMLVVLLAGAFISWETLRSLQTEQNVRRIVAAATAYAPLNDALNDERAISQTAGATPEQEAWVTEHRPDDPSLPVNVAAGAAPAPRGATAQAQADITAAATKQGRRLL